MWKVDDKTQTITLTRGDTPRLKINCNVIGEDNKLYPYEPEDGDIFVFAVKQNKFDDGYLFAIEIPNDTMTAVFKEEHTKELELGKYMYEVSLRKPYDGYCCTFIDNKVLMIQSEVY